MAKQALLERGWLSRQSEDFRRIVLNECFLLQVERGATVYNLGDPPGGIYGLASGALAVSIAPGEGGPYVVHLANPGDWFGEAAFLTGQPRRVSLGAATDCVLMNLPLHAMERMAAEDAAVLRRFAQIAVANLDLAIGAISDLMISEPQRRIAAVLARASGSRHEPLVRISQAELGQLANASRKLVNKALRLFARSGWAEPGYNAIKIRDLQALRAFAANPRA